MVMGEEKCYKGLPYSETVPPFFDIPPAARFGRQGGENQTIP